MDMHNSYNLFLDDYRLPINCITYVNNLGIRPDLYTKDWVVVKNYNEFTKYIKENGLPSIVSFDHDLADIHYGIDFEDSDEYDSEKYGIEETGMDCAKWLIDYCMDNHLKLPEYYVHSMNPVGRKNIKSLLDQYKLVTNGE